MASAIIDLTGKICDFTFPFSLVSLVLHEMFGRISCIHIMYLHRPALTDLDLEEDDDEEVLSIALDRTSLLSHFDDEISDDDDNSSGNGDEHTSEASIAQTGHSSGPGRPRTKEQPIRNGPIVYPLQTIDVLPFHSWYIRPGDTVELHPVELRSGVKRSRDFIHVQKIVEDIETGEKYLRGFLIRRIKFVTAALDFRLNETCLVLQEDEDDKRDVFDQGTVDIPVEQVLRPRNLIFSSTDFPEDSFREFFTAPWDKAEVRERARLVCRWVWIETFESAAKRKKLKPSGGCLRRLIARECADDSFLNCVSNKVSASRQEARRNSANRPGVKRGKYTYASGFCGAGGDALGAKWAGLDVSYGWDSNRSACETFRRNFPRTTVFCSQATDFPPEGFDPRVDILHLSFPCKYFSPNHTRDGKDDGANTTVIFTVEKLLKDAKPIYATQENTFGLHDRHPVWFDKMINMIIKAGYDVRWKIFNFVDFGLSAKRKRLIIYAARRGYPLPRSPSPTHGEHNHRYIYDAILNFLRSWIAGRRWSSMARRACFIRSGSAAAQLPIGSLTSRTSDFAFS